MPISLTVMPHSWRMLWRPFDTTFRSLLPFSILQRPAHGIVCHAVADIGRLRRQRTTKASDGWIRTMRGAPANRDKGPRYATDFRTRR